MRRYCPGNPAELLGFSLQPRYAAIPLSCLFGDDEVAQIGSLFRGSFSPEDE